MEELKKEKNIKLTLAYNGGNYVGWQIQPNGISVQAVLFEAIYKITKEKVLLHGSGRTDAGVHAAAQTANFKINTTIPAERFALALNTVLPKDIRVIASEEADPDFHSRFSAKGKTYCYRIFNRRIDDPFYDPFCWHIKEALDVDLIKKSAEKFIGTHDFCGFMSSGSAVKTTIRTIHSIDVRKNDALIELTYTGNGFLYNMVRIITGTIIECAQKKIDLNELDEIIQSKDRNRAGKTAPACGLMLMKVLY